MTAATVLILIATERVSGPLKGIFQYLRHLDRERYRPILCLVQAARSQPSDAEREARVLGIPVVILEQSGAFDWTLVRRVKRLARERQAAIIQSHGYKTHLIAFLVKRSTALPWLGFEHGWTAENWRIRLYQRLGWLLRYADRVVVVSDTLRSQLLAMGVPPARLDRIHNAVELDEGWSRCSPGQFREAHRIPVDAPLIAVVGRISTEKGQRVFLDAFARLMDSVPLAHAVIVGEGVDRHRVQEHALALGLGANVRFLEWQQPVAPVFVDADIIAIPSLSEGISNVLLEAMAAGCPVVATAVGGTPEVVAQERHALLVPPSDPASMAEAMVRILRDKRLRDRLVEDARSHVQTNHFPKARADRIAEVYDSLGLR